MNYPNDAYQAYSQQPYLPTPPRKRRAWPAVVGVLTVLALVGGAAFVLSNRPAGDAGDGDVAASVVDASGSDVAPEPSSDRDGDGLTDADEARYGTNPEKPDTDNDGFNDGTEVANGYNPSGAGKLTSGATAPSTPSEPTPLSLERSGTELSTVYAGSGSYQCQITGGITQPNTVTVKVKDGKVRQETPIEDSTIVFIVDGSDFYMNGFKDGKWLKLAFNQETGTASGPGANVSGGIFASESLVLAAEPTNVACEEAALTDDIFSVPADQLLTQAQGE